MKKPNFFIIGAPKCGTTSLAMWLDEHPQVFVSPVKEPNFFNVDFQVQRRRTLHEYEELFSGASDQHRAVGEATTGYLRSHQAVKGILDYSPAARFIVCIRNPIDMAVSMHGQRLRDGREVVRSFEQAWRLDPERLQGRKLPPFCKVIENVTYGPTCRIGKQLESLYSQADSRKIHVIVLEDMKANPADEFQRVLDFLQVDPYLPESFAVHNPARTVPLPLSLLFRLLLVSKRALGVRKRFGINARLIKSVGRTGGKAVLSPDFRRELLNYYEEDIGLLERILDRDFSKWRWIEKSGSAGATDA